MPKPPISFETFERCLLALKKFDDTANEIYIASNRQIDIYDLSPASAVVRLLEEAFRDTNGWISYFCWELNFGARYEDGTIVNEDGDPVRLSTTSELYELIIQNYT